MLELLQDEKHTNIISWAGTDGEFKLLDPEAVSMLWGMRKRKPCMNYDKLSRAIRYYYDKKIMHKVHGKRYVYKFNFDTITKYLSSGSSQSAIPNVKSEDEAKKRAVPKQEDTQQGNTLGTEVQSTTGLYQDNDQSGISSLEQQLMVAAAVTSNSLTTSLSPQVPLFNLTSIPTNTGTAPVTDNNIFN